MFRTFASLVLALALSAPAIPAAAQSQAINGTIEGTVLDPQGAVTPLADLGAVGTFLAGSEPGTADLFALPDGLDAAAAAGIRAVIQPGGSVRDDEVIAAADEHGIAMVFTSERHFRH